LNFVDKKNREPPVDITPIEIESLENEVQPSTINQEDGLSTPPIYGNLICLEEGSSNNRTYTDMPN
jgi:hypothetical protein